MPVALSTTKRKFHQILDSISNASNISIVPQPDTKNASTITLPATFESPAKKARTARPVSALVTSTTETPRPRVPLASANKATSTSSMATVTKASETPNFAPWDRAQFLKRLESFRHVDKWRGKPDKINEVQWAKRGWSCVGRDTVRCVGGCSQDLVVKLESDRKMVAPVVDGAEGEDDTETVQEEEDEDDWREKALQQLIEKYVEKTVTGHAVGCLWRRKGCDDTIFRLPLYHQATAIASLRQRYESLLPMAAELPTNLSTPSAFELSKSFPDLVSLIQQPNAPPNPEASTPGSSELPSSQADPTSQTPISNEALKLALFGWQAETGHIPGLATCTSCYRRLGLWLFRPRILASGEEKASPMARLDVVEEHRDYCPWINALSQNGPPSSRPSTSTSSSQKELGDKAGWELLSRIATNAVQTRKREREEPRVREAPPATPRSQADDVSVSSTFATATTAVEGASRDEKDKDKERWARLKKLKHALTIRKSRKKESAAAA